eukprot:tig00020723_g13421.t1
MGNGQTRDVAVREVGRVFSDNEAHLDSVRSQLKDALATLRNLKDQVAAARKELEDAKSGKAVPGMADIQAKCEAQMKAAQARLAELEQRAAILKKTVEVRTKAMKPIRAGLKLMNMEKNAMHKSLKDVVKFQDMLRDMLKQSQVVESRLKAALEINAKLRAGGQVHEEKLKEAMSKLASAQAALDKARAEVEKMDKSCLGDLRELQGRKLADASDKFKSAKFNLSAHLEYVKALQEERERIKTQLKALKAKVDKYNAEQRKLHKILVAKEKAAKEFAKLKESRLKATFKKLMSKYKAEKGVSLKKMKELARKAALATEEKDETERKLKLKTKFIKLATGGSDDDFEEEGDDSKGKSKGKGKADKAGKDKLGTSKVKTAVSPKSLELLKRALQKAVANKLVSEKTGKLLKAMYNKMAAKGAVGGRSLALFKQALSKAVDAHLYRDETASDIANTLNRIESRIKAKAAAPAKHVDDATQKAALADADDGHGHAPFAAAAAARLDDDVNAVADEDGSGEAEGEGEGEGEGGDSKEDAADAAETEDTARAFGGIEALEGHVEGALQAVEGLKAAAAALGPALMARYGHGVAAAKHVEDDGQILLAEAKPGPAPSAPAAAKPPAGKPAAPAPAPAATSKDPDVGPDEEVVEERLDADAPAVEERAYTAYSAAADAEHFGGEGDAADADGHLLDADASGMGLHPADDALVGHGAAGAGAEAVCGCPFC